MNDEKLDSFFIDDVYKLLDQFPDVRYNIDYEKSILVLDTQGDQELTEYLYNKLLYKKYYWGVYYWNIEG